MGTENRILSVIQDVVQVHDVMTTKTNPHGETLNIVGDANGDYAINLDWLMQEGSGEVYEGESKLLAWHLIDERLIIEGFTSRLIHLTGDLHLKQAYIKSTGPCQLSGDIHVNTLTIADGTDCILSKKDKNSVSKITIDTRLIIKEGAELCVLNADMVSPNIINQGHFYADNSVIDTHHVTQLGLCEVATSSLIIREAMIQEKGGITRVTGSSVTAEDWQDYGETTCFDDCSVAINDCSVYGETFECLNHSDINIGERLYLDANAQGLFEHSNIAIEEKADIRGALSLNHATLNAECLSVSEHKIQAIESKITTSKHLVLDAGGVLAKTAIACQGQASLNGDFALSTVNLEAHNLELSLNCATIERSNIKANILSVKGGENPDFVTFDHSTISGNLLSFKDKITFKHSLIQGTDKRNISHINQADLTLIESAFITQSQVTNTVNSTIKASQGSMLDTGLLYSKGGIQAQESNIVCEALMQRRAVFEATGARIAIKSGFDSQASLSVFKNESQVLTQYVQAGPSDNIALEDHSALIVEEEISLNKTARLTVTDSGIKAQDIDVFGHLHQKNSLIDVDASLLVGSTGRVMLEGNSAVLTEDISLSGQIATKKEAEPTMARIKVNNALFTAEKSKLSGDEALLLEAEQVVHAGLIELTSDLRIKGCTLNSWGDIKANSLYCGLDDALFNLGTLSANTMTVHSNMFNFGEVYAKQSYSYAGLVNVNAGLMAANNYNNNSFFSLNAGLILPNFSADKKYLFSVSNLTSATKTIATSMAPGYANLINLGYTVPSLASTGYGLYHTYKDLDWDKMSRMRRHEWIPLVCQAKSAALFTYGAFETMRDSGSEWTSLKKEAPGWYDWASDTKNYSLEALEKAATEVSWAHMGMRGAAIFAGGYNEASLIRLNAGMTATMASTESSLIDMNAGLDMAVMHTVNTHYLDNQGVSYGIDETLIANRIYNSGELYGAHQFVMKAEEAHNTSTGIIEGNHVNVHLDTLTQEGKLTLKNGQAEISHFKDSEGAVTELEMLYAKGQDLKLKGEMHATNVQCDIENSVEAEKGAHLVANNLSIKTKTFSSAGTCDYSHGLSITADEITLDREATLTGSVSDEKTLFTPTRKETPLAEGEQASDEKDFNPQSVLSLHAKHMNLNGHLSGGDYADISGQKQEGEETPAKCEAIVIGENADIKLLRGNLSSETIDNLGHLDLTEFHLNITELHQENHLALHSCSGDVLNFNDAADATTLMDNVSLKGQAFDASGHLDLEAVRLEYSNSVIVETTAKVMAGNTEIDTSAFTELGRLDYHEQLMIKAKTITLAEGATLEGQKTDEDKLYVPKENSEPPKPEADATTPQDATAPTAPEKDFKPQHILIMETDTPILNGTLIGGDYTLIHGMSNPDEPNTVTACTNMTVGESGFVDIHHGGIHATHLDVVGNFQVSDMEINAEQMHIYATGHGSLDNVSLKGTSLMSEGKLAASNTFIQEASVLLTDTAKETIQNTTIEAKTISDFSELGYSGQVGFIADTYVHGGQVYATVPADGINTGLFYVKAKTADFRGAGDIDNAYFDIEHFNDGIGLVCGTGKYAQYHVRENLTYLTADSFHLNTDLTRECGIGIQASDIEFNVNYNQAHNVSLKSTVGDVAILGNITANNVSVQSAGNIFSNKTIYANKTIQFEAEGKCYNLGGTINGETVAIKATNIENIAGDSYVWINQPWLDKLVPSSYLGLDDRWVTGHGSAGIINGRDSTYLEATHGNINNWNGVIRGGDYTQLVASGDVVNACSWGPLISFDDTPYQITKGLIAGGCGSKTDGVGLFVSAGNKIISYSSDFLSNGVNHLIADKGFDFRAASRTYESNSWSTKSRWGKTKTHKEITTEVIGSSVQSTSGYNYLQTEHGGVMSVSTLFSSPGGTDIYAQDDVLLYSTKGEKKIYDTSSSLWGLSRKNTTQRHEISTPTLFIDNGATHITSTKGNVDARGAYFIGNGDISIKAAERIKLGLDVLDHEVIETTQGLNVSIPVLNGVAGWQKNGIWGAMTAEDATLSKLNSLLGHGNTEALLADSANLGINLYNTTNSLMRGLAHESVGKELLARYGLGGKDGFSPTVNFTYTDSKITTQYQTLSQGGIDRGGNVVLEAGSGIDLENGVQVHAGGNMDINAPELIAKAAELHSAVTQQTTALNVSASISGVQDVGLAYSISKQESTHFEQAAISANGNLKLHCQDSAIHTVILDGATIDAKTLDANIETLVIKDRQDVMHQSTTSISASVGGQVAFYQGHGDSTRTAASSGIHVIDGINNNGHSVHVDNATMVGGKILTDGVNDIEIGTLNATTLVDTTHYTGVGLSFNVNDLKRFEGQTPSNEVGEQAIAIAQVNIDHIHDVVTQTPVVYGEQGTNAHINTVIGDIQTQSANGTTVLKHDELHLEVDAPITNQAYLAQSAANIKAGLSKVVGFFKPEVKAEAIPAVKKPMVPVKKEVNQKDEAKKAHKQPQEDKDVEKQDALAQKLLKEAFENKLKHKFKGLSSDIGKYKYSLLKKDQKSLKKSEELKEKITLAVLQILKEATEDVYAKFAGSLKSDKSFLAALKNSSNLEKVIVNTHLSAKGLFFTIGFNLGLAGADSGIKNSNIIKQGLAYTASDFSIGLLFKLGGALEGPLNWGFVIICAGDTLFYDKKTIDGLIDGGYDAWVKGDHAMREGHYLEAIGWNQLSMERERNAGIMGAMHEAARVYDHVSDFFSSAWNKVSSPHPKPDNMSSIRPYDDKHRFFGAQDDWKVGLPDTTNSSRKKVSK